MARLLPITIACAEYDRTRPLKDGRVRVDGCEVTYLPLEPEELFFRAFRYHDFDVAELSFNSTLMTTSRGVCPYVAIPAFVSRHFRHSAIFIRTDRGIRGPSDLKGKLVGLPEYQQTANVWMRGIFKEEHGLQCGYCTPGMMMTATALLEHNTNPTEAEIRQAISGNLCRCTGYVNIVKAVQHAAGAIRAAQATSPVQGVAAETAATA